MRPVDGPSWAKRSRCPFGRFVTVFANPVFRPTDLALDDLNSLSVIAEPVLQRLEAVNHVFHVFISGLISTAARM